MNDHNTGADSLDQFTDILEKRRQQRHTQVVGPYGYTSAEALVFSFRVYMRRRRASFRRSIEKRMRRLANKFRKQGSQE
ncbi:hypothetical protein YA62_016145 [Agrobacterium sp. LC34]|uniref:hypothetical protein n=1 Tax=Rhizobium/Agrobacterium group TaxID=227290 RepID=UPI000AE1F0BB|nr:MULTISPECIES: hypothetical protein [Rhizobium/Agrobacterium group]TKT58727.1 hypothetical protein YA62_016145 [Agrobacterium sp. LC34]